MQPETIISDADHEAALKEIERLWDAEEGTADGDLLNSLISSVEAYEEAHFTMQGQDARIGRDSARE